MSVPDNEQSQDEPKPGTWKFDLLHPRGQFSYRQSEPREGYEAPPLPPETIQQDQLEGDHDE